MRFPFLSRWCSLAVLFGLCLFTHSAAARTVVPTGNATQWRFWDQEGEPPEECRLPGFDDSKWKSGPAPLGFGEARLGTEIAGGPDRARRVTTWFRHRFVMPWLRAGERLILFHSVDDGAVFYVDGVEIGRANMPAGKVRSGTLALKTIANDEEGFYRRLPIPSEAIPAGQSGVLAVEVHQASTVSSDLYFDAALKVLPVPSDEAAASAEARAIAERYNREHFLGPDVVIPDGYFDGGRRMAVDTNGKAASGREILLIDRVRDDDLAADLAFARSAELQKLSAIERVQKIAERIDRAMTPPGGTRWLDEQVEQVEEEFAGKPILLGAWIDQCQAGVCRHRALLFKLLANEAGLRVALVRGNFAPREPPGFPHAWNEVTLENGRRVVVDVMHHGGEFIFPSVTHPNVVARYLKVDGTPWYAVTEGK